MVCFALLASLVMGFARIRWENEYRSVALAVNLGDLHRAAQIDVGVLIRELQGLGLRSLIISPQDVVELHQQFFPSLPAEVAIPVEELERFREEGFTLFWLLDAWVSPEQLSTLLRMLFEIKAGGVLLGHLLTLHPEDTNTLLSLLQAHSALVGLIEFEASTGVERLYEQGYRDFVRVHTLKIEERSMLSESATVDRYVRAAVERNVRLMELRALAPQQIRADYTALENALYHAGFTLAMPSAPSPFTASPWLLTLVWLGLVSLLILVMGRLMGLSLGWLALLWAIGAFAGLAGLFALRDLTQRGAAWLTAISVPVAAFVFLSERPKLVEGNGLVFLLIFSLISTVGGLVAATFVSTDAYFLGIQEFPGVKAALVLPMVCVALLALLKMDRERLRVLDVILWVALGILLPVVLIRSGNFSIWPASESEVSARNWLEEVLIVRPRFKEFLIGHPLLLLWGGLGILRWHRWALAILLAGLLGQVSILNSFVHLHTPLWVTLLRTFHGLWIGAALGWPLQALLRRVFRFQPAQAVD